jgi:hypothetical protein
MKTKLIGAIVGVSLLTFLFVIQFKTTTTDRANPNSKLLNMHFSYQGLRSINSEMKIDTISKKIVAFVSPTCPHCHNFLRYIQHAQPSELPIFILFRDSGSDEAILDLIKSDSLSIPLFSIKPNEVTDQIKFVPTFLLVDEKNMVVNAITGAATNKLQFDMLFETLLTK